ncbi:hypothetical protein Toce_0837 [Thermosediminibacter oceani DSM 16646]|uniref:Uncharacterized protein n=1 Tax=Thermosediminibacter oceani (strain ATCC BAA-1034 / DSM 16646 / JW/IW-1228P) TaxID=555079 RepID=D9S2H2_THEOJ|nr:hypothetical protein Toce_0837 [Thermosediminibacter oceani DSM 16646]
MCLIPSFLGIFFLPDSYSSSVNSPVFRFIKILAYRNGVFSPARNGPHINILQIYLMEV